MNRIVIRRRQWHPTPVLLPGKSHGWRSLVGCNPWGRWGSDTTEGLNFHFPLSCTGEGNGNPLQCSCLENPRDGAASWAAVYGVTQSRTRLKRLSSSSSRVVIKCFAYHVHSVDTWKLIMYNIYIVLLNENKDKKDYNFTLKCACVYLDDCISKYANCDYHPVVDGRWF